MLEGCSKVHRLCVCVCLPVYKEIEYKYREVAQQEFVLGGWISGGLENLQKVQYVAFHFPGCEHHEKCRRVNQASAQCVLCDYLRVQISLNA